MIEQLPIARFLSNPTWIAAVFSGFLFVGMLCSIELGRWLGSRALARGSEGIGVVDGAIFSLFGLLVAFTFSGAAARFDHRRELIVEETNATGTAWLRVDLLPAEDRPPVRDAFRRYLDWRLETYRRIPDMEAVQEALGKSTEVQEEIWSASVEGCRKSGQSHCSVLLLPALNAMFDIATTRTMAARMHPPVVILQMLALLALTSALLAGHGMAGRSRGGQSRNFVHMFAFSGIVALTTYVILDLEYPRLGSIRVDSFDAALVDLRRSMD